jgi:TPP-dependent pyruvate/acetoin dehydrogenase alpha subunit
MNEISETTLLNLYRKMKTIRYFEEAILDLYKRALMRGAAHLCIGEEAVAAGVCEALTTDDYILSTHRGHGHCLAKGADPRYMMAEMLGKQSGYCKGKGGSMHISDFSVGVLCANGIVGGGLPISVGAGLASRLQNKNNIIVCFFGDGAVGQGSFHESLNLASIWQLPILFVCENNQYAISTHYSNSIAAESVAALGMAYQIESIQVDGNDVLDVFQKTARMKQKILEHQGPKLIEAHTYRLRGHYIGDTEEYREKKEVKEHWKKEPIDRFEKWMAKNKPLMLKEMTRIDEESLSTIEDSVAFGMDAPAPDPETALRDVFNKSPYWEKKVINERDYRSAGNK